MALKSNNITKFANSLTDFLIDSMTDKHTDARHIAYRYNNLKVYMDPLKVTEPHFFVSLGISEACYDIESAKKIDGGLGPEDGLVSRWASRSNIYNELKNHWKIILEASTLDNSEETTKRASAALRLRRAEMADEDLNVDMTGTGISRTKRSGSKSDKRKYFYNGKTYLLTPEEFMRMKEEQGDNLYPEDNNTDF
jgi:hypothetical protein